MVQCILGGGHYMKPDAYKRKYGIIFSWVLQLFLSLSLEKSNVPFENILHINTIRSGRLLM